MSKRESAVQTFSCVVEWRKSRVWGYNPKLEGWNGSERVISRCSGCGYDKLSTVVADFINRTPAMLAKIQELTAWPQGRRPYGFSGYNGDALTASGGVGIGSLIDGLRALGISVVHTSGDTSNHFTFSGDFTVRKSIRFVEYAWRGGKSHIGSVHEFAQCALRDEYTVYRKFSRRVKAVAK